MRRNDRGLNDHAKPARRLRGPAAALRREALGGRPAFSPAWHERLRARLEASPRAASRLAVTAAGEPPREGGPAVITGDGGS